MNVQPIYNSRIFKKGLEFAANNGALFTATASLALSTIARPVAILSAPKTDKENKKYACAKSLSSSAVGYLLMLGASMPVAKAVGKIDKNPSRYLKETTIKTLQAGGKSLLKSKRYKFATQLFKLGLGFVIAAPKAMLTCVLIPPIMDKIFPKKDKNVTFTGNLSKGIGKLIDSRFVQKMSEKFYNTRFEQHMICLTDLFATGIFIEQTKKNKKIEQERKKTLMYNAGISTGLCIGGSYIIDNMLKKPTEKFIEKFSSINKNSPKLEKYIEGIRIVKPALIMGGLYYIAIPFISTFWADRIPQSNLKRANDIKTMPPKTSKNFDGIFLKNTPAQKPLSDIKKDIKPIIMADNNSGV